MREMMIFYFAEDPREEAERQERFESFLKKAYEQKGFSGTLEYQL